MARRKKKTAAEQLIENKVETAEKIDRIAEHYIRPHLTSKMLYSQGYRDGVKVMADCIKREIIGVR